MSSDSDSYSFEDSNDSINSADSADSNDSTDSVDDSIEIDYVGKILKNRYAVLLLLGSGAFATVWLSYDIDKNTFVAIKILNEDDYDSGLDEIDILNKINKSKCKYFNKMIDNFTFKIDGNEHICIITELLAGSIYDLIIKGKYSDGLELNIVKKLLTQILLSMKSLICDLNLLHTDIKPENILLIGKSKNICNLIDDFKKLKVKKILNKYKSQLSRKKGIKKSHVENIARERMINEVVKKLELNNKSKYNQKNLIDDEYINMENINVKLSDFGGCCEIKDDMDYEIQTRYYRSPEAILGYKVNKNTDVWSLGCLTYELLFGELLFDPDKDIRFNRDRSHLFDFQKVLGPIPKYIINESKKSKIFFSNNGLIKNGKKLEYCSLFEILKNKLKNVSQDEIIKLTDFLYQTFEYDPDKRTNVNDLLSHPFLAK